MWGIRVAIPYKGVNAQEATTRATSDKIVACRTHARVEIWGVHTGSVRACVRQIGMSSYLLEYGIIFIGIWHHIYWNMASYLLEYGIILI